MLFEKASSRQVSPDRWSKGTGVNIRLPISTRKFAQIFKDQALSKQADPVLDSSHI